MGVRHTKIFPDVGTDPVSGVLMVHGRAVNLVLARAWHVQVLSSLVKLHAEGELSLLHADSVGLVWVARVGEVEVASDVVLGTWNTHELDLVVLLLLDVSNLGGQFSTVIDGWAFPALGRHAERCTTRGVGHMHRVVCAWAQHSRMFIIFALLIRSFSE